MGKRYIVVVLDGAADRGVACLGGKTPLQFSYTPNLDKIASAGYMYLAPTIPQDLEGGTDVGHVSILGYDPHLITGRAPLEIMGTDCDAEFGSDDLIYRLNTVQLVSDDFIQNDFRQVDNKSSLKKHKSFERVAGEVKCNKVSLQQAKSQQNVNNQSIYHECAHKPLIDNLSYAGSKAMPVLENNVMFKNNSLMLKSSSTIFLPENKQKIYDELNERLGHKLSPFKEGMAKLYPADGYRGFMVLKNIHHKAWQAFDLSTPLLPPHFLVGKALGDFHSYNIKNNEGKLNIQMSILLESLRIFTADEIKSITENNLTAVKSPNAIWIWGQGKRMKLPAMLEKYSRTGSVITATEILRGIGRILGLNTPKLRGATGDYRTDYKEKTETAIKELDAGSDFVLLHFDGPDEASHRQSVADKIKSIEMIDKSVGELLEELKRREYDWSVAVLADHYTYVQDGSHGKHPVPFASATKNQLMKQNNNIIKSKKNLKADILKQGFCEDSIHIRHFKFKELHEIGGIIGFLEHEEEHE